MTKRMSKNSQYYTDLDVLNNILVHSQIGDEYDLAQLGDLGDLLDKLANYDREDLPINSKCAHKAIDHFLDQIQELDFSTYESALKIIQNDKSIGFGAKDLGVLSRDDPLMENYLSNYYEASADLVHHVIITASQKDEVRPLGKQPRLFMSYPPEHTFLAIICLNDFMEKFKNLRFTLDKSCSAVGDSPQNGAAAYYKDKLTKMPYLYATDTKAQDSSVSPEFIELVYSKIKSKFRKMKPFQENLFDAVRFNSLNKYVNVNGHIYLINRGLGSGDYLTTIINIMWRLYLIFDNYNHDLDNYFFDNVTIINGDDLAMSSKFDNLDLNSRHATIEWAGKPVKLEEMDFCSLRFSPFVHHDPKKVLAVLGKRNPRIHMLSPFYQLQRLGGLLRVLSTRDVYETILRLMKRLAKQHNLQKEFIDLFVSYDVIYQSYNNYLGA